MSRATFIACAAAALFLGGCDTYMGNVDYETPVIPGTAPSDVTADIVIDDGSCVGLDFSYSDTSEATDPSTTTTTALKTARSDDPHVAALIESTRDWQSTGYDGDGSIAPIYVACGVHAGTTTIRSYDSDGKTELWSFSVAVIAQTQ